MAVNCTAVVELTLAFLPYVLARRSEAALHAFVMCLRRQLEETAVKVVELLPPAVQTELRDSKHQDAMEGIQPLGMPLDRITDAAYKGLADGRETIIINEHMGNIEQVEKLRGRGLCEARCCAEAGPAEVGGSHAMPARKYRAGFTGNRGQTCEATAASGPEVCGMQTM